MAIHFIPPSMSFQGATFSGSGMTPMMQHYDPLIGVKNFHSMFNFDGLGGTLYEFRAHQSFLSDNFMNRNHFLEELQQCQYDVLVQSSGHDALMIFLDFNDYQIFSQSPTLCRPVTVDYDQTTVVNWLQEEGFKPHIEYRTYQQAAKTKIVCRAHLATLLVTRFGLPSKQEVPF